MGTSEGSEEDALVVLTRGDECLESCRQSRSISLDLLSRCSNEGNLPKAVADPPSASSLSLWLTATSLLVKCAEAVVEGEESRLALAGNRTPPSSPSSRSATSKAISLSLVLSSSLLRRSLPSAARASPRLRKEARRASTRSRIAEPFVLFGMRAGLWWLEELRRGAEREVRRVVEAEEGESEEEDGSRRL